VKGELSAASCCSCHIPQQLIVRFSPAPFSSSSSANQTDKGDRTSCEPCARAVGSNEVTNCCPNCSDAADAMIDVAKDSLCSVPQEAHCSNVM
jgi:hypothetical protein